MSSNLASPSVRALARKQGVDLEALAGRLGKTFLDRSDVEAALGGNTAPAFASKDQSRYWDVDHAAYGEVTAEPVSRFAKAAAENLTAASVVIPSVTHHDSVIVDRVEHFRGTLKGEMNERGIKLSMLAFHVKALALCLRRHPRFNTSLSADGETLYQKHYVHIGMAVDTPHGLMVPVIRDADSKGVVEIASEIVSLAGRGRDRKLKPEDMGGASMTISNLGGIGGEAFTPIINPPEVAILGITRGWLSPEWDGEQFVPKTRVPLDLTYDHRVINGALAAQFLVDYARLIEHPWELIG